MKLITAMHNADAISIAIPYNTVIGNVSPVLAIAVPDGVGVGVGVGVFCAAATIVKFTVTSPPSSNIAVRVCCPTDKV